MKIFARMFVNSIFHTAASLLFLFDEVLDMLLLSNILEIFFSFLYFFIKFMMGFFRGIDRCFVSIYLCLKKVPFAVSIHVVLNSFLHLEFRIIKITIVFLIFMTSVLRLFQKLTFFLVSEGKLPQLQIFLFQVFISKNCSINLKCRFFL